jgi:hypothetical protein
MSIHNNATTALVPWKGRMVSMMGLPAGSDLFRIFRYPGADWNAPAEAYRFGRLDPPVGHKSAYSILYTAESELTAAFEARAVRMAIRGKMELPEIVVDVDTSLTPRQTVVHQLVTPAMFVNLEDRATAMAFGLDPDMVLDDLEAWRLATFGVWQAAEAGELTTVAAVAGVCHQSKHRGSNGWNFGLFHGVHATVLRRGQPRPFDPRQLL